MLLVAVMTAAGMVVMLFALYARTPAPEPVSWSCPAEWTIMPGDTLWRIAETCWPGAHTGQMVAAIREANPGVDPGRLRVGQTLRLPTSVEIAGGAE